MLIFHVTSPSIHDVIYSSQSMTVTMTLKELRLKEVKSLAQVPQLVSGRERSPIQACIFWSLCSLHCATSESSQ